ncbi:hypothetical protein ACFQ7N_40400 [Streptomyces niveus]|uniref:hypothetical protein n=1 Tax=Streptomyces niveus TaxID=193462 RepID=UPI0036BD0E04
MTSPEYPGPECPEFTDTRPFPNVTLREHPDPMAGSEKGPTFEVFVTGWRVGGRYKTRAGAMRRAERESLTPCVVPSVTAPES